MRRMAFSIGNTTYSGTKVVLLPSVLKPRVYKSVHDDMGYQCFRE